jgi:hypothetical protein
MALAGGVGVTTGCGTGLDLTGGTGRDRPEIGAEKACWFIAIPQRLNIVSAVMLLVFIFCL